MIFDLIYFLGWFCFIDDFDKFLIMVVNVVCIMFVRFFCCKLIMGFLSIQQGNNRNNFDGLFEKLIINFGVFNVLNIYEDFVWYIEKRKIIKSLLWCLRCLDNEGIEFFLLFELMGVFYFVELRKIIFKKFYVEKCGYVYFMYSMMEVGLVKDVILSLLYGKLFVNLCGFIIVFKICDIIKDYIVVVVILFGISKLLEFLIGLILKFVKVLNIEEIQGYLMYQEIECYLVDNVDVYVNEMKVCYNYNIQLIIDGLGVLRLLKFMGGIRLLKFKIV